MMSEYCRIRALTMRCRFLRLALAMAALAALMGCASVPGGGTLEFSSAGPSATGGRAITVNVDASQLSGDRRAVFLEQAGSQKLAAKVLERLSEASVGSEPSPDTLNITVTHFRLRSGSTGFWLGFMSGTDKLQVSVEAVSGTIVVKKFDTRTATAVAGIIRPGSVERFDRMVRSLAQRIVDGI